MDLTRTLGAAALLAALPAAARAQEADVAPASDGRVVYAASFYARFAPSTALDMIRQTPGFTLEETSARRGFTGAGGNVLVDGERPVAKSQTLSDILQRIPAAQVVRIELLRGAEAEGNGSGHAVIANIVRTASAGQGVYQAGFEYAGHTPMPNGWASWSGRIGTTDYAIGTNGYSLDRVLPGKRLLLDGAGAPTGYRIEDSPRVFHEIAVNGEASRPMLGGRIRLTGQAHVARYHEDTVIASFAPEGTLTESEFDPYTERTRTYEAGLNYDRTIGAWETMLAALLTRKRFTSAVTSTHSDASGAVDSVFDQQLSRGSGETILRATAARAIGAAQRVEIGAEGAVNTLDQRLTPTLDLGNGPFVLALPNANLAVKERRGEAYLVHNATFGRWAVETRLAGEVSHLAFTGDTEQSVDHAYFKPSIQLTRRIGARNQLRARLYRDVGQLDFDNFVTAVSVGDDRVNGGNPDLRPETSWRAELAGDFRFGKEGAAGITLFHYWISDTADLVPVGPPGARIDAPGNIGDGTLDGVQMTLRLPLGAVLRGASLSADGTWRHSRVTDPLTGERRAISEFEDWSFKAEFRHDLPGAKLAWGATFLPQSTLTFYRLTEIERDRPSPSLDLWAESGAIRGLKVRLTLLSLLDQPERRERIFFAPDRTGALTGVERTTRHPGRRMTLTVSGSF